MNICDMCKGNTKPKKRKCKGCRMKIDIPFLKDYKYIPPPYPTYPTRPGGICPECCSIMMKGTCPHCGIGYQNER